VERIPLIKFLYIVQLLERGSISGDLEGHTKLLEILQPPILQYLPENALKIGNPSVPTKKS
jgi:hypothetical protein